MPETESYPLPFRAGHKTAAGQAWTVREREMARLSAAIREKPDWHVKIGDPAIVARWTEEAAAQGLTAAQVRYVLAELAWYASLRDEQTGIEVAGPDGVWQSDTVIDVELRSRLRAATSVLEDVPEPERDWHPGSNGMVLDLVHPSLFPLVRGVSQPDGAPWPALEQWEWQARYELSDRFQWLPSDVEVSADGEVTFASYINNVHPVAHRDLAAVLPEVLGRMLPLLEHVLTGLRHPRRPRIGAWSAPWYPGEPVYPECGFPDDAASAAWNEAYRDWYDKRTAVAPDAPEFTPPAWPGPPALSARPGLPDGVARVNLRGRRLQVIVKLAAIHLTPERPEYPGGGWHVEGMLNERIVATGIYYWDSENVTESRLGFRAEVEHPQYEQGDRVGPRAVYGITDEYTLSQDLGAAATPAGRALAFPNILQHRVSPFRLADPARPGHRKILAFFLVDPSVAITSTADVPPQQPWAPTSTMTLGQARQYREELMKERSAFVTQDNKLVYEREYSLCEH